MSKGFVTLAENPFDVFQNATCGFVFRGGILGASHERGLRLLTRHPDEADNGPPLERH
ncbi:MAG TPA: hypothetical protein PKK06_12010 [Phycisphaerae bacterium]|nr:hypothetical protein [Phycisphaerae bacterium]HNU45982.1 hypothetical protein [Phycisphaerae bacterium]